MATYWTYKSTNMKLLIVIHNIPRTVFYPGLNETMFKTLNGNGCLRLATCCSDAYFLNVPLVGELTRNGLKQKQEWPKLMQKNVKYSDLNR